MSSINDERIKLSLKSSNYAIATSMASTEKDIEIYLLANNCNLYNWNNSNSGAIYGAELININTNNEHHEPYIAIDHYGKKKLAQFNNSNIQLNRDVIPWGNEILSLGSETNRWKDIWLSGNTMALGNVSMGSNVTTGGLALTSINPIDPNAELLAPPGIEGGGLTLISANGGKAVMTLSNDGKVGTKTTTASGEIAAANMDIDGDLLVTRSITTSNIIVTSNIQVHNLEIFNTSNNNPSLLINNGNNQYNIFESSNEPLNSDPYITILTTNH